MTTSDSLRAFIIDNFLFGQDDGLTDDTSFIESGIISSTGILELIAFLETHYRVRVADDEIIPDNLDSIRQLTQYLESKGATRPAGLATCKRGPVSEGALHP